MKRAILFALLSIVVVAVAAALIVPLFAHGEAARSVGQAVGGALLPVGAAGFIYGWNTRRLNKH
jgi:hypothetical protein